ncbi:MAG: hypothetical protein HQL80_13325 [Magnetococcales bacterium]|nr:hypothetical protein [Magnetococcales bacterium]MBF0585196.1 hypothetical protein [Magnetococcales bacterium]
MNVLSTGHPVRSEAPEQLAVLLALAAGQSPATGPCPAPEVLIDLLEGRVSHDQRQTLLEHLDHCADCYRAWLGAAALQVPQPMGRLYRFRRSPYLSAFGALALAASLVLMLVHWDPLAPNLSGLLASAYQTALLRGAKQSADQPMSLPTSEQSGTVAFSFSSPDAPMPVQQAFAAGARAGWAELVGQPPQASPATDKDWVVYYDLGRWTVLLQTLCQSNPLPSVELLHQHTAIGQAVGERLSKRLAAGEVEARISLQEVTAITQLLQLANDEESVPRLCRRIQKSCATIAEGLLL